MGDPTEEPTFSAKQIATRIGTDGKTLRKFFRDSATEYDSVGQGGRYEFPQKDLDLIKADFMVWQHGRPSRNSSASKEQS